MAFQVATFEENVTQLVAGTAKHQLLDGCREYGTLTTPHQRACSIQGMMVVLDRELDAEARWSIMEACGRICISAGTVAEARQLQREANDLDDLLCRLNEAHIGGGQLRRKGDVIRAAYESCYCGSVSHTREPISATYCRCSCGWFRELFETLLERPVEVELLSSIIQGHDRCGFAIRIPGR